MKLRQHVLLLDAIEVDHAQRGRISQELCRVRTECSHADQRNSFHVRPPRGAVSSKWRSGAYGQELVGAQLRRFESIDEEVPKVCRGVRLDPRDAAGTD